MGTAGKRKKATRRPQTRRTRNVLDRHGHPAQVFTSKDLKMQTGSVLRAARQSGAVAISRAGKPVAVALAPDHFVMLCVAYATRSLRRL